MLIIKNPSSVIFVPWNVSMFYAILSSSIFRFAIIEHSDCFCPLECVLGKFLFHKHVYDFNLMELETFISDILRRLEINGDKDLVWCALVFILSTCF